MYQLEPVDLYVTHGEVSVPPRGPRQLWPLLPHNRVGDIRGSFFFSSGLVHRHRKTKKVWSKIQSQSTYFTI